MFLLDILASLLPFLLDNSTLEDNLSLPYGRPTGRNSILLDRCHILMNLCDSYNIPIHMPMVLMLLQDNSILLGILSSSRLLDSMCPMDSSILVSIYVLLILYHYWDSNTLSNMLDIRFPIVILAMTYSFLEDIGLELHLITDSSDLEDICHWLLSWIKIDMYLPSMSSSMTMLTSHS